MNKYGNSRYKETENKIKQAFLSLLRDKHINHISVNEICCNAHISRPSFYTHYEDINDLIMKIEYEKSAPISSILTASKELSQDDFANYLNYVKENKCFYIAYFQYNGNANISQSTMNQYLTNNDLNDSAHLKYHMLFFMAGLKAVVYEWLSQNCPETIEQLSQVLLKQYRSFINLQEAL